MRKLLFTAGVLFLALILVGCGIPQQQYDTVVSDLNSSQQELKTTKGDLDSARSDVSRLNSNLDKARTEQQAVQVELTTIKTKNTELAANLEKRAAEIAAAQAESTRLKQDIDGLKTRVSSLEGRIPNLAYSIHTDNERGFSIDFPANWEKKSAANVIVAYAARDNSANFVVVSEPVPASISSAQAYSDAGKQQLLNFLGSKAMTVNGLAAVRDLYVKDDITLVSISLVKGNNGWVVISAVKSNNFVDLAHTFNEIFNSFKLLK